MSGCSWKAEDWRRIDSLTVRVETTAWKTSSLNYRGKSSRGKLSRGIDSLTEVRHVVVCVRDTDLNLGLTCVSRTRSSL